MSQVDPPPGPSLSDAAKDLALLASAVDTAQFLAAKNTPDGAGTPSGQP